MEFALVERIGIIVSAVISFSIFLYFVTNDFAAHSDTFWYGDVLFMYQVQGLGFEAKVHGDVLCGHLPEWPLSTILQEKEGSDV